MFKWLFKKKGCAKHMNNKLEVIGIDHGWSMMKTISQVFVTGVKEITTTPALFGDVLEYEGKFYKVGTVRQEVKDTKVEDDSFYLLTLAAVAKELKRRGIAEAKVFLAVGLPLTRFGAEKNDFIKYLTKNKRVSFKYENESYHIEIDDVAVFPQCYAAVVDKIPAMAKKTLIVDIGSWTIDIMPVINKSPDESKCVTIPKGLITCMRSINEQCVRQLNGEVDESEIQNIMRYGRSDIDDEYFAIIKAEIEDFVDKVYNSIREFGYNLKTTPIVFVGGGAVVMKNFGSLELLFQLKNLFAKERYNAYVASSEKSCVLYDIEFLPVLENRDTAQIKHFLYWETYYNQSDILLISNYKEVTEKYIPTDIDIIIKKESSGYDIEITENDQHHKSTLKKICLDQTAIKEIYQQLLLLLQ